MIQHVTEIIIVIFKKKKKKVKLGNDKNFLKYN